MLRAEDGAERHSIGGPNTIDHVDEVVVHRRGVGDDADREPLQTSRRDEARRSQRDRHDERSDYSGGDVAKTSSAECSAPRRPGARARGLRPAARRCPCRSWKTTRACTPPSRSRWSRAATGPCRGCSGAPFLDKPILYFWMQAASLATFGASEFAVRLPGTLMAVAGIAATGWLAQVLFGVAVGRWAALVLRDDAAAVCRVADAAPRPRHGAARRAGARRVLARPSCGDDGHTSPDGRSWPASCSACRCSARD